MKAPIVVSCLLLLSACRTDDNSTGNSLVAKKEDPGTAESRSPAVEVYPVEDMVPGDLKDTLLANMITFIYKRPTTAINRDRTDPQFRAYYVDKLPMFQYVHHYMDTDSTHWFYLIRPARSVQGDKRGVGGRFRTNASLEMVEFEEIFNTPIMDEGMLREKGRILFDEMVATGGVDAFLEDRTLIEWPDGRLFYSKEKREWRYVD